MGSYARGPRGAGGRGGPHDRQTAKPARAASRYKGRIVGKQFDTNGSTFVIGIIDVEALRHHRTHAQVSNWMKDVRAELAQLIYEQPIYPANLDADQPPGHHQAYREQVPEPQVERMVERGIWQRSGYDD